MEPINNNHVNNFVNHSTVHQLKKIVEAAEVCMFETILPEPPFSVRPMIPVKVNDIGTIWFFSSKSSKKNKEITSYPHVQLLFSNIKKNEFLSIYGSAEIITDKKQFQNLWNPIVNVWFPDGINDPDLSLIKVTPESSFYWDTKHNKMAALINLEVPILSEAVMNNSMERIKFKN